MQDSAVKNQSKSARPEAVDPASTQPGEFIHYYTNL